MFRKFAVAASLAAMLSANAAHAQEGCLSEAQANALIVAVLPGALTSVRQACLSELPSDSALARAEARIADVYQPAADKAWPVAGQAFMTIAGSDLPQGFDVDAMRPFADAMIGAMIASEIKPNTCAPVNDIYSALEPLPAENVAVLLTTILKLADDGKADGDDKNPLKICKK